MQAAVSRRSRPCAAARTEFGAAVRRGPQAHCQRSRLRRPAARHARSVTQVAGALAGQLTPAIGPLHDPQVLLDGGQRDGRRVAGRRDRRMGGALTFAVIGHCYLRFRATAGPPVASSPCVRAAAGGRPAAAVTDSAGRFPDGRRVRSRAAVRAVTSGRCEAQARVTASACSARGRCAAGAMPQVAPQPRPRSLGTQLRTGHCSARRSQASVVLVLPFNGGAARPRRTPRTCAGRASPPQPQMRRRNG
jgi:hypothetical protein